LVNNRWIPFNTAEEIEIAKHQAKQIRKTNIKAIEQEKKRAKEQ
jgi:hypothetical protein